MTLAERLGAFIGATSLKNKEFAEILPMQSSQLQRYLAGTSPSSETLEKLARVGCNVHWLVTGEGTMYANNAAGKALQEKNNPETFDENTIADMSVVGINRVRQTSETILPEQLSEIENDIKQVLLKIQSMMK